MKRFFIISCGVIICLSATAAESTAQWGWGYPSGYSGYGWGGWGSYGSRNTAAGLGYFAAGEGRYNVNTARANSVNVDTVLKWNHALWQAHHAQNVANYIQDKKKLAKNIHLRNEIYDRVRNHPQTRDIIDGDAMNVLLDILISPEAADYSLRQIKTPIDKATIRDIPFEYASEGISICLNQITSADGWPLALNDKAFEAQRHAVHDAVREALDEDKDGDLSEETIKKASDAITKLRTAFEAQVKPTDPGYGPAENHLKALAGLSKMLNSPKIDKILSELDQFKSATVGDLLSFMQAFNLRFAPARSFHQREIYLQLHPILAGHAQPEKTSDKKVAESMRSADKAAGGSLDTAEESHEKIGKNLGSAANSFFEKMSWDHLKSE